MCGSSMSMSVASWLYISNERMRIIVNEGGAESMED
jgi:hypothetical protein